MALGMRPAGMLAMAGVMALSLAGCGAIEQALAPDPQLADTPTQPTTSPASGSAAGQPAVKDKSKGDAKDGDKTDDATAGQTSAGKTGAGKAGAEKAENSSQTPDQDGVSDRAQERFPFVAQDFPDVLDTPEDLRDQVTAVVNLGVIAIYAADVSQTDPLKAAAEELEAKADEGAEVSGDASSGADGIDDESPSSKSSAFVNDQGEMLFAPNQGVTRRQYVRWLVAANNVFYGDRPSFKLRLAPESSDPVFKDVTATDPDFAVIQGLAEAGILPSSLSGAQEQISFKPDAPLKREDLLLWKLPLDVRGALPASNLELVKEAWGFQDASKISTPAQRAVLADYQNGDQAIIRRLFGYTTLFQPSKPVTRAEAVAALAYFGSQDDLISAMELDVVPTVADPETVGG